MKRTRTPDNVLVNLPSPFLEDQMMIYPLGILNVATYCNCLGINTVVLDLARVVQEEGSGTITTRILDSLLSVKAPYVGVSLVTPQARFLPLVSLACREKILVAGGPHPSILPEEVSKLGYSVIVGEGENGIHKLFFGDSVKRQRGVIIESSYVEDLDTLPFPDRTLITGYKGPAPIMAGRGCPYHCTFCSKPNGKAKVRFRSPENVIEEIRTIKSPDIIFYDDTFTLYPEWTDKFCQLVHSSGIKKRFRCSTRADKLTPEIVRVLKSAGFYEVCVGVESGSQRILDGLRKGTTVEENTRARKICKDVGIKFKAFIMIGTPGEDITSIESTEAWLTKNRPDTTAIYLFHPLPGSHVWNDARKYDIQFDTSDYDFTNYGGKRESMSSSVSTSHLSARELTQIYWRFLEKFSWPRGERGRVV